MSQVVRLDLNNIEFQSDLFGLQKPEQLAVLATLRKLASLTWDQVHRDKGLHLGGNPFAQRGRRQAAVQPSRHAALPGSGPA